MTVLWIDFETRSRCDLTAKGLYNYSSDPSTEIVICSYAVDMGPIKRWMRLSPLPDDLLTLLKDPTVEIRAHSAAFERLMLRHCWKLDIPASRFYCTAFQARSCSLPGSLADVGRALTARMQKDPRGVQLIRLLSIPREDGSFNEDAGLYREFGAYCDQDVNVMRMYSLMLPQLDSMARRVYAANEAINDRGLPIDRELCTLALKYADAERAEAQANIERITGGTLTRARGKTLTDWVYDGLPERAQALMRIIKRRLIAVVAEPGAQRGIAGAVGAAAAAKGEEYETRTLDGPTRAAIFAMAEESPEEFDEDVMAVIAANDAVQSSSVYKFKSMLDTASADGRLRGAFIAGGAAGTGRFSSHAAQLHNYPRKCHPDPEAAKALMRKGGDLGGPVLEVLKSLLRPAIWPGKGRSIVRADWNAIEARALPWLTARASAVAVLDAFADPARDPYVEQAVKCRLGENRQAGKVLTLAFGYGGSVKAFNAMAKGAGLVIEGDKKSLVEAWRRANPWAPEWWKENERSAQSALAAPVPLWFAAGRVGFRAVEWDTKKTLTMLLPSGRTVYYPYARPEADAAFSYLKAAWKPKAEAEEWPRARAWGGLLAENCTQACCADLLREALVLAVESGLPVIGHVHDEIVCEASDVDAPAVGLLLRDIMAWNPEWAAGLPLAVEVDISPRYRK